MKRYLLMGLTLIAGLGALWYILTVISLSDVLETFSQASITAIVAYLTASAAIMICLAWRWQIILESQGYKVSLLSLTNYRIVGYGISYLTPTAKLGGEPVRAALLRREKIDFSTALSSVVIDKTVEISSHLFFFMIGLLAVLANFALPGNTGLVMALFGVFSLMIIFFLFKRLMNGKSVIRPIVIALRLNKLRSIKTKERKIERFEGLLIKFFREDRKHFILSLVISFISWILMFVEFKTALLIVGFDVDWIGVFLVITMIGASVLIPVPMAIGAMEAGQVAAVAMIGLKKAAGVGIAFITRARDLAWSVIGILLLTYYGMRISSTIKQSYSKSTSTGK